MTAKPRKTKQREAILRVLRSTTSHPTAEWVYERVREEIPRISLGTVYRNLRQMSEAGLVMEIDSRSFARFDGCASDHYHFFCELCGSVLDLPSEVDYALEKKLAVGSGHRVFRHRLELYGVCRSCLRQPKGSALDPPCFG